MRYDIRVADVAVALDNMLPVAFASWWAAERLALLV